MDGKLPPPNLNLPYREDYWSEGEMVALIDAWGSRYLDLNCGSLINKFFESSKSEHINPCTGEERRRIHAHGTSSLDSSTSIMLSFTEAS